MKYKIKCVNEEFVFNDYDSLMTKLKVLVAEGKSYSLFYKGYDGKWHYYNIEVVK